MREPFRVEVVAASGTWVDTLSPILDTGFDGGLIVPQFVAGEIATPGARVRLQMPDGVVHRVEAWRGQIDVRGHVFPVWVQAFGREPILGREVLDQMEVCFVFGREVRLRFEE